MSSLERSQLERVLDRLLHLHDSPARTAAAFALGVFFSFSPFIGLQIAVSMLIAVLFRLNRLAVFVGLNANLPWILVPWYAGTTIAAAAVLGYGSPVELGAKVEALFRGGWSVTALASGARDLLSTAFVPLLVGSTIGAAIVAALAYPIARHLLERRARRAAR